jgi:crotonobetainyl-CoA:carnitine CoA-transferase CaiB-like acyl-CoA transferase
MVGAADLSEAVAGSALGGITVVDCSDGLAGAYCTKLLADAGADVVTVEPPGGAPGRGSALFGFLHTSKRSVVVDRSTDQGVESIDRLFAAADIVVEEGDPAALTPAGQHPLLLRHPGLIVVSTSAFGLHGPWATRAGTDLTFQALSGSIGGRGEPDGSPVAAGGQLGEWAAGLSGAVGALVALRGREGTGVGDHVDVSRLESSVMIFNGFQAVAGQVTPTRPGPFRVVEVPSIEPAKDGWVGLCALSSAQFNSFADMIGAPEWATDPEIQRIDYRASHPRPLRARVAEWTTQHLVNDIVEEAARRRIPSVPVGNGETAPRVRHLVERGVFVGHPGADFVQPRVPYRLSRTPQPALRPAPALGSSDLDELLGTWPWPTSVTAPAAGQGRPAQRPLEGVRVFDFTSFWAGPIVGQLLGFFGADVIKVESVQRPDGTRLGTSYGAVGDRVWERAPLYQAVNTGKRGITLDLTRPEGRDLARRLLKQCDVFIENYSARVVEQFGLLDGGVGDDLIVVRMPAFGLTGPWRDLPGFAQTMEQVSGLAWVTGFPDGPPLIPRGPCDPIGGLHAALATLLAIRERDRTGLGQTVEVPLLESALNVAAEQIVEWSANGLLLQRLGNHHRSAAPHNVYRCLGDDAWVALAIATDGQWQALRAALGQPEWAAGAQLDTVAGRLAAEDVIDEELERWCRPRPADEVIEALWPRGVPIARVAHPRRVIDNPQLWARGFFEPIDHSVVGTVCLPGFPARLASQPAPLHRFPAPTLGQHNEEILGGLLGISADELTALAEANVIGDRPLGA